MQRWCFRCSRAIESELGSCPNCGTAFADVYSGHPAKRQPPGRLAQRIRQDQLPPGMVFKSDPKLGRLSKLYGVPEIHPEEFEIAPEVVALVPRNLAAQHRILPINRAGASFIIAMEDPSNISAIAELERFTQLQVEVCVCSPEAIDDGLLRLYPAP